MADTDLPFDLREQAQCPYCKVVAATGWDLDRHIKERHAYVMTQGGFVKRNVASVFD